MAGATNNPAAAKPAEEKPAEEKPAAVKPVEEKPVEAKRVGENPPESVLPAMRLIPGRHGRGAVPPGESPSAG